MNELKPITILKIYEGDIDGESTSYDFLYDLGMNLNGETIELTKDQKKRIMKNVKKTLMNDQAFFDEYFAVVRDCIKEELGINE